VDVITQEFWAQSLAEPEPGTGIAAMQNAIRFQTIYLSHRPYGPKITAEVCLSRLKGGGSARCVVFGLSFFFQLEPEPLYTFPGSHSGPIDSMAMLLAGPSSILSYNAHSITFELQASNMFAYATATIFVEPVGLLQRLLATTVDAIRIGPRTALARAPEQAPAGSIAHVAYDRRTGEIVQVHEAVAAPGVYLPSESELSKLAGRLFSRGSALPDHIATTAIGRHTMRPGHHYRIDPSSQRLLVSPPSGS
jgi:hypothetical protein